MEIYNLPGDLAGGGVNPNEVIIRHYGSSHNTVKNKIVLNCNLINLLISGTKNCNIPENVLTVAEDELVILLTGNILTSEVISARQEFSNAMRTACFAILPALNLLFLDMNLKEALQQSGQNLRRLRNDKGFSVEALSALSGVDVDVILAIEDGHFDFPLRIIFEISATLNVDFRQILVDPTAYG